MTDNAFTPQEGVPARLTAGDLWAWRADRLAGSYPPGTYTLAYHFKPLSGGSVLTAAATADADGWGVEVDNVTTAALAAGDYLWSLSVTRVSDGGRATIATARVVVDPAATAPEDSRTAARRHLEAIEAVIEGRITKDVESYTIEGRALTRTPLEILHKLRARYLREVQAEDAAASGRGGGIGRYRKVRFSDA